MCGEIVVRVEHIFGHELVVGLARSGADRTRPSRLLCDGSAGVTMSDGCVAAEALCAADGRD